MARNRSLKPGFTLRGCYPSPWQDVGEYATAHAAVCALASRIGDYDNMVIHSPEGKIICHYNKEHVK